jgi:hypothetical protein
MMKMDKYEPTQNGRGISSCLQILIDVNSTISLCLGIDDLRLLEGFSQIECSLPSRTSIQPCCSKC